MRWGLVGDVGIGCWRTGVSRPPVRPDHPHPNPLPSMERGFAFPPGPGHPLRAPLRLLASPYAVRRGRRLLCLIDGFSGLVHLVSEVGVLDGGVVD